MVAKRGHQLPDIPVRALRSPKVNGQRLLDAAFLAMGPSEIGLPE